MVIGTRAGKQQVSIQLQQSSWCRNFSQAISVFQFGNVPTEALWLHSLLGNT